MDKLFKALSGQGRLHILDVLRERDGQTLRELEGALPRLSRCGVMKHLKILEAVNLITTRKVGKFKYHYLNLVPIQEISERWVSNFARPLMQNLTGIKNKLEGELNMDQKPKHVFTIIIQTSAEKLWEALTKSEEVSKYFFGLSLNTTLQVGGAIAYEKDDGTKEIEGKLIEVIPQKKLVHTFCGKCSDDSTVDKASRVTYEIEGMGKACKLTLIHDEFEGETETYNNVGGGWPTVLSSLKTLLETGKPLNMNDAA